MLASSNSRGRRGDGPSLAGAGQFLERGKELVVDEGEQRLAGDAFGVGGPGAPVEVLRERRAVVVLHQFEFLVLVVDDLEEEHPAELGDALGVAVDADVLAHDVLDGFDGVANRHGLGSFLIERGLGVRGRPARSRRRPPNVFDEFDGRADGVERRNLSGSAGSSRLVTPFVLILLRAGFEHGAGLRAVLGEDVALADVLRAFASGERRLVEGDVADEIEGVEVLADFVGQRFEQQPFALPVLR